MQKYLSQLHVDLVEAHRPKRRYVTEKVLTKKFGDICGIQKIQFPPSEKLTKTQQRALCKGIRELISSWRVELSLPRIMSLGDRYYFLKEVFDTEVILVKNRLFKVELCDYDVKKCTYGERCICKKGFGRPIDKFYDFDDEPGDSLDSLL